MLTGFPLAPCWGYLCFSCDAVEYKRVADTDVFDGPDGLSIGFIPQIRRHRVVKSGRALPGILVLLRCAYAKMLDFHRLFVL